MKPLRLKNAQRNIHATRGDHGVPRIGLHLRLEEEVAALTPEHYQNGVSILAGINPPSANPPQIQAAEQL